MRPRYFRQRQQNAQLNVTLTLIEISPKKKYLQFPVSKDIILKQQ